MGKKEKYFRNRSNTAWLRYIRDGVYDSKKQASNVARFAREQGSRSRVVKDDKTKKYVVWTKMI